jgi:hypothetical protein
MDVIEIAKRMNHRINALETARGHLQSLAALKAESIALYEKVLAVTIIKIKNGMEVELEGRHIVNPPVTIMEKIARGICWEEKLAMEKAEALYKAETVCMSALAAELNGYQSINKYLGEVND